MSVQLDLEDIVARDPQKHYFGTLAPYINNSLFALVILMNLGHAECTVHLTSAL